MDSIDRLFSEVFGGISIELLKSLEENYYVEVDVRIRPKEEK
jgi:hypothetical protein